MTTAITLTWIARPVPKLAGAYEYLVTEAGNELHLVLHALKEWGDRHNPGREPVVFSHVYGAEFHPLTVCEACREPLLDGDLTVSGGTYPVEARV